MLSGRGVVSAKQFLGRPSKTPAPPSSCIVSKTLDSDSGAVRVSHWHLSSARVRYPANGHRGHASAQVVQTTDQQEMSSSNRARPSSCSSRRGGDSRPLTTVAAAERSAPAGRSRSSSRFFCSSPAPNKRKVQSKRALEVVPHGVVRRQLRDRRGLHGCRRRF